MSTTSTSTTTSSNNGPKIDLLKNIISDLTETIRETTRDIRTNENTLYQRKKTLKEKLKGNPEPGIIEAIIKEMKFLSAGIVKQKAILSQAEALKKKLLYLHMKLKKLNGKTINNINKELNPKKPSFFSVMFTKKNKNNGNKKNKTLNNLKTVLSKHGVKNIKGVDFGELVNFNPDNVTVTNEDIEKEFNAYMKDIDGLQHAATLSAIQRGLENSEIENVNTMSPNQLRQYLAQRAKTNAVKLGLATNTVEGIEEETSKGGKRKTRRSKSRKASRRRLTRRRK